MKNKTNAILGAIFILAGAIFLMKNFNIFDPVFRIFSIGTFWPLLFVILPGLIFHYSFFAGNKKNPGLLVPGGILLVIGTVFQVNMLIGGWDVLWPFYIFAVAFGLFELYAFGNRDKGLLIPIGILGGLSMIFFAAFSINKIFGYGTAKLITPVVLIGIGLIVIFGGGKKKEF